MSSSQSKKGLNQKAAILLAPVASALRVPSTGPVETRAPPFLRAQRGCPQKEAADSHKAERSCCSPFPSCSLRKGPRVGATDSPSGPLRNSLPAWFSSSVWSHPRANQSKTLHLHAALPREHSKCFHVPYVICFQHSLVM